MQISRYRALKSAGKITLERYGLDYLISKQQYDSETGILKTPESEAFKRDQIVQQINQTNNTLLELNALLADIDALP